MDTRSNFSGELVRPSAGQILQMSACVSVRVPATSANLGCLFDCGAIALNLYVNIHVTSRTDDEIRVLHYGIHADRVCEGADNLVARTLQDTLRGWGKTQGSDVKVENEIPVGVGVGSSAGAIVGALAASHVLTDRALIDEEIVSIDIGMRLPAFPGHTTVHAGPHTAVRQVERSANRQSRNPERVEVSIRQRQRQARAIGKVPRTMGAARRGGGEAKIDAPLPQLDEPHRPALPLLPDHRPQPAAGPFLKAWQHRGRLALPEVAAPAP